jgi:hypothetical protein
LKLFKLNRQAISCLVPTFQADTPYAIFPPAASRFSCGRLCCQWIGTDRSRCHCQSSAEANLAGHDSHDVIRTPIYIQWLKDGDVIANHQLKIICEMDSLALVNGQQGYGQSIGRQVVVSTKM